MRVPTPDRPGQPIGSVQTDRAATPFFNVRAADTSAGARDLGRLADGVGQLAMTLQKRANDNALQEASVEYMNLERELLDPQNGVFARRQGNAAGVTAEVSERMDQFTSEVIAKYGERLSNSGRRALEDYLQGASQRMWRRAASHELAEGEAYQQTLTNAQIEGQIDRASLLYTTPDEVAAAELQIRNLAGDLADAQGLKGVAREQFIEERLTGLHSQVASQVAATSPSEAVRYIDSKVASGVMDATEANRIKATLAPAVREERVNNATTAIMSGNRLDMFKNSPLVPGLRNINYDAIGTRDDPLQPHVVENVNKVVTALGPNVDVRVTSAGQPPAAEAKAGERTGTDRHDHGNAVDLVLVKDGKEVTPSEAPDLYEQFFRLASPIFPGMGHYSWGIHVGGGTQAFWGPDTTSATADETFAKAAAEGRSVAAEGVSIDDVPADIRADVVKQIDSMQKDQHERVSRQRKEVRNALYADIDEAFANGEEYNLDAVLNQAGVRDLLGDDVKSVREYYEARGEPQTDNDVYRDLQIASETRPDEFANMDLGQYRGVLSPEDYKGFVNKQASTLGELSRLTPQDIRKNIQPVLTGREPEQRGFIERRMQEFVMAWEASNDGQPPSALMQYNHAARLAADYDDGTRSFIANYNAKGSDWNLDLGETLEKADTLGLEELITNTDLSFAVQTPTGGTEEVSVSPEEMRSFAQSYTLANGGVPPRPSQVIQMMYFIKSGIAP